MGDVRIGERASVWYQVVIRADMEPITIGDRSNIQDLTMMHVDEGVPCVVGNDVTVGHRAILHGCIIEDECLVGMGAILLNNARVGRGSVIAAGALIRERMEIPPGSLVMGMPGKVIRPVDPELRQRHLAGVAHYMRLAEEHRSGKFKQISHL